MKFGSPRNHARIATDVCLNGDLAASYAVHLQYFAAAHPLWSFPLVLVQALKLNMKALESLRQWQQLVGHLFVDIKNCEILIAALNAAAGINKFDT